MAERSIPPARGHVRGQGKGGAPHWLMQRASAIALVPLTVWLVASLTFGAGRDHAAVIAWLGDPLTAILMVLLLITAFHHLALGLQVVIEDYVHSATKLAVLIATKLLCVALCATGILAVIAVALGG